MTDFDRARKLMVDNQLLPSGITDRRLLAAMGRVPRESFVPEVRRSLAYLDGPLAVGGARKLGAPAPFAQLLQLAAIQQTDSVLDLGCSTGYSAAVLAQLADSVVAVESEAALATQARVTLNELGVDNVEVIEGAFETAGKGRGPFDAIIVEGAVDKVPDTMLAQLKPEGRLVALIAEPGRPAVAHLFVKSGKAIAARAGFDANLPPLTQGQAREDRFVF